VVGVGKVREGEEVAVGTTLAFRFPLGRYHANPWDRAVNEGASEWPPSPWRILRALVATWYIRWPDLPPAEIDGIVAALADPPSYRAPATKAGHTRHYLPGLDHRTAEHGNTALTLDPFLAVSRQAELLVRWDAELTAGQRQNLAKLAELIPYLGRAESVCEARLLDPDDEPEADETWWRPGSARSANGARLLAPELPFDRLALEATTASVRKERRTLPPGTRWVTYAAGDATASQATSPPARTVHPVPQPTAIRFAVVGRAPVRLTHGVLVADEAHRTAGKRLERGGIPDARRREIMGTRGAASDHQHAHWIPVGEGGESAAPVRTLIVWTSGGLATEEVGALLDLGTLSGKRGGEDGYEIRGFPEVRLLFQAAGQIADVAPELCATPAARVWRSVTPYLPVRYQHRNRETTEEFLADDIAAELRYRHMVSPVNVFLAELTAGRVNQFRRYRTGERLRQSRMGVGLRLEFASPVSGPVLLGQLSHFGFGRFAAEE
jgi:CRISPR-associated protein Csb2